MTANSTKVKLTLKITSFVLRLLMNIFFYILVVILIVSVSKMAYDFTYQLYGPVTAAEAPGTDIIIQIKKGESTMDIASKLENTRAIKNKYAFYLKTKLQSLTVMPGTYEINSSMTYDEILDIITDYSASIIKQEGETKKDTGATGTVNKGAGTEKGSASKDKVIEDGAQKDTDADED